MKVLLLGAGAVGESYAVLTNEADPNGEWLEKLVIADFDEERAQEVAAIFGGGERYPHEQVDASDQARIEEVLRKHQIDLVMNGCPQHFDEEIFDAAYNVGCHYMDMAMTLSERHEKEPYKKVGVMLGDYQFERAADWEKKGLTALLAMGIDPGISNVFARYVTEELFDEVDEIGVRDGANMAVEGVKYATQFSVWSVIEECLNPPVFWEKEKGHFTGKAMSEPEVFDFPELGPIEVVSIEHEEVITLPRNIDKGVKKVNFKISLGEDLMKLLRILEETGLASAEPIDVKGVTVSPRDVVEACFPDPAGIGSQMKGKICVGVNVTGKKDGKPREIYIYQITDNTVCMDRWGCQAVAAQTSVGASIATELLAKGVWKKPGVLAPENFDPKPALDLLPKYGFPWQIRDSWAAVAN